MNKNTIFGEDHFIDSTMINLMKQRRWKVSKTIENLKRGNYSVVDNQGVSVTIHFVECLEKEFADLEAKLAESKEKINKMLECYDNMLNAFDNVQKENEQLKQQLAEKEEINRLVNEQLADKDKELKYFKKQARRFNNEAQKYYEDAYCNDFHNQDKISFAVERLEKVKEFCGKVWGIEHAEEVIEEYVDNKIAELKKEMK